jgi:hypothetical protein
MGVEAGLKKLFSRSKKRPQEAPLNFRKKGFEEDLHHSWSRL